MIVRRPDWRPRLHAWLGQVAPMPFTWGRLDCALFAAGAIEAMTGHDLGAPFRGRYGSATGARRVLRAEGHENVAALAASLFEDVDPAMANEGDLAVIAEDGPALGIVGRGCVYAMGETGLRVLPAADRTFEVPLCHR